MSWWDRIRRRKLVQWAIAYLAAASLVIGVASDLAQGFAWAVVALRVAVAVLAVGFLALIVVAWYHGEKGRQQATAFEIVVLAILFVVAGIAAWVAGSSTPNLRPRSEGRDAAAEEFGRPSAPAAAVAVFPFAIRGADDLAYLREGMVDLLSVNLSGTAGLRSIPAQTILNRVWRSAWADGDLQRARDIADELGSTYFVLGSLIRVGSRIRLSASWYSVHPLSGDALSVSVEGEPNELIPLVDGLTADLLVAGAAGLSGQLPVLAARTTESMNALKAFLDGEFALRRWSTDAAATAFRRAIDEDSTFAFAYYRLAWTAAFSIGPLSSGDALPRAVQLAARLPDRERKLVQGAHAFLWEADVTKAERLYREVLRAHPEDIEALWGLGDVLFHYACPWGRPTHEVRASWERVVAIDPNHIAAIEHLSWLAGIEGRHEDARRYGSRVFALTQGRGDSSPAGRVVLAYRTGDPREINAALAMLRATDPAQTWMAAFAAANRSGLFSEAIDIATLNTEASRPLEDRVSALIKIADIELARGRPRAADSALARAALLSPSRGNLTRALFALRPYMPQDEDVLASRQRELEGTIPETSADTTARLYLLGLLSTRMGDHRRATRTADELERRAKLLERRGLHKEGARATDLALSVAAEAAHNQGAPADALQLLQRLHPQGWWALVPYHLESQELSRWLRAEILVKLERQREALDWFAMFGWPWVEDGYRGAKYLRIAEIHELLGEHQQALQHYQRLISLWEDPEPALHETVVGVRERIARLTAAAVGASDR